MNISWGTLDILRNGIIYQRPTLAMCNGNGPMCPYESNPPWQCVQVMDQCARLPPTHQGNVWTNVPVYHRPTMAMCTGNGPMCPSMASAIYYVALWIIL